MLSLQTRGVYKLRLACATALSGVMALHRQTTRPKRPAAPAMPGVARSLCERTAGDNHAIDPQSASADAQRRSQR
jgi:hypothetical protein